jgi:hypothetical protein
MYELDLTIYAHRYLSVVPQVVTTSWVVRGNGFTRWSYNNRALPGASVPAFKKLDVNILDSCPY